MYLSSVGALLISYPCVNGGKSAVQLRHLGIASYSWQNLYDSSLMVQVAYRKR